MYQQNVPKNCLTSLNKENERILKTVNHRIKPLYST